MCQAARRQQEEQMLLIGLTMPRLGTNRKPVYKQYKPYIISGNTIKISS
jgi:hypothetical protein